MAKGPDRRQQPNVDPTEAVRAAAQERVDDDAPSPASDVSDATAGGGGGIAEVVALAEEQLADAIGQTSSDGEGLEGSPEDVVDAAKDKSGRYDDWVTGGDADATVSPQEQAGIGGETEQGLRPGAAARAAAIADLEAAGGAEDVHGNKIDLDAAPSVNPVSNSPAADPLSSFVDGLEAKTGRDSGLATPDDDAGGAPAFGKDAISAGWDRTYDTTASGASRITDHIKNDDAGIEVFQVATESHDLTESYTAVVDKNNGTVTYSYGDGSTRTVKNGSEVDSTPPLKTPGPDDEVDPLPEDIQRQLEGEVARLRNLRNQGPDSGDGATDPSEIESEVVGPAGELESHAAQGRRLFGQPDTENEIGGGAPPVNPGADSQGAGVITPGDDQTLAEGARRDDNPFDSTAPVPEPAAEPDADDTVFLPPRSEIDSPVDTPGDDLPDVDFDEPAP